MSFPYTIKVTLLQRMMDMKKNRYTYYKLTITRWDWIRCILL